MLKKFVRITIVLCLISIISIISFASETLVIGGGKSTVSTSGTTVIPVKCSGTQKLMGFKISIEYPADKLEIVSVSKGSSTSNGSFNDNLGLNEGKFDVLWNHSSETNVDGVLFNIGVIAKKEFESVDIKVSFSQADTFDGSYKDVALQCENISVSCNNVETTTKYSTEKNTETATEKTSPITDPDVLDAVNLTLKDLGLESINNINKDNNEFVSSYQKNIEKITGQKDSTVDSVQTIVDKYTQSYISETINEINSLLRAEDIKESVENALKDMKLDSIEKIPSEQYEKFVKKAYENLSEKNKNIPDFSKEISPKKSMDIIKSIYDTSKNALNNNSQTAKKVDYTLWIVIAVIGVFVIVCVVFFIKKRKMQKKQTTD